MLFEGQQGTLGGGWEPASALFTSCTLSEVPAPPEPEPELWTHKQLKLNFAKLNQCPDSAHVDTTAGELALLVEPILDELPDVRAFLAALPMWKAWVAIVASAGCALRHPIAVRGGTYDVGHDPDGARGNGWGQLSGAILATKAQRGRTAARHWADAMAADAGVRLPRYTVVERCGWRAPARRRRDGTLRKSAGRVYRIRRFVQSEAYFTSKALKEFYMCVELAPLRAALAKVLPDRWVEHARYLGGRGGRVGYWHRIKRTRAELVEYREDSRKARKTWRKRQAIIAAYPGAKRSSKGSKVGLAPGISRGGSGPVRRHGADPPAREQGPERFSEGGPPQTAPSTSTYRTPMPPASPETARQRESAPPALSADAAAARASTRALTRSSTRPDQPPPAPLKLVHLDKPESCPGDLSPTAARAFTRALLAVGEVS